MMGALKLLLSLSLLLTAAQSNILDANDSQTCTELCASCDGKATFENGICKCVVQEDDIKGRECVMRLKRESGDLGPDSGSGDLQNAERTARCSLLGSRRRMPSVDADRVASYFMEGGPVSDTPMLSSSNGNCVPSSGDPMTGAINLSNAKPRPVEPQVAKHVDGPAAKSPVVAAPSSPCSSPQYQPVVSSSSMPSYNSGHNSIIGAPQPYQTAFYPHMLQAVPHIIMAIPNAVAKAASHIPSYHPGTLGASHYSPILASLASGTHSVLQHLDKMVAPSASENHQNKIVGAPRAKSDCPHSSQPSYSSSKMTGASAPDARPDSTQINASMMRQVLAEQNSLLEALSHQLESLRPQVGPSRSIQYTPVAHPQYMVGAPQSMGHYSPQPMVHYSPQPMAQYAPQPMVQYAPQPMDQYLSQLLSQYCPDGSSIVGSPKATESLPTSSAEMEIVGAPKDVKEKEAETDKKMEESKKSVEEESQKTKREVTRTRSASRKKRGDVKYAKKKETIVDVKSL